MNISRTEVVAILKESDIVEVRQKSRQWALDIKLGLVDQTKMVTAASELARNTLVYGGGGLARFEIVENGGRKGLRLTFEDEGPGIPNIELALSDHYSSGKGMGLGLGGSKRLVNEFEIFSEVGKGTRVIVIRWK